MPPLFSYGAQKFQIAVSKLARSEARLADRLAAAWDDEISILANSDMPDPVWLRWVAIQQLIRSVGQPTDAECLGQMSPAQLQEITSHLVQMAFETETARAFAAEQGNG